MGDPWAFLNMMIRPIVLEDKSIQQSMYLKAAGCELPEIN
jgi:hypothetical protein